jgi:hypothetical protein|tara:strand:+ start:525 stop:740 length:216 start_codon:yes stop_codon:yes gene_type:complete
MAKEESFTYFNDEWNIEPKDDKIGIKSYMCDVSNERDTDWDGGDEDFIDNVDVRMEVDEIEDFDDYEEYGN